MGLNYVDISIAPPIYTETTIIPGKQGIQGIQGDPGVFVGTTEPTDESVKVWINPDGMESDIKETLLCLVLWIQRVNMTRVFLTIRQT